MHNSLVAIGAAALAAWLFGAVYYGVLGKAWMQAQSINPDDCKGKKMPIAPMVASLAGVAVMAAIFQKLLAGLGLHSWQDGLTTGLMIGVGFIVTTNLVNNMFQQKKPML